MTGYNAYIFDLDGTLLNTLDDLAMSVNYALGRENMPQRTVEEVRGFVGNGVRKLIERAVPYGTPQDTIDKVLAVFREYYFIHSTDKTGPYAGIMELLSELKRCGKRVAVVSNKFDAATKELCRIYFGDYVEVAIGESASISRKPSPDGIFESLRLLGMPASDAIYIGDSDVDIQTAKNAGIRCVSVLWGFRNKDFLTAHGATDFVETPHELLDIYK